jgi:hypothetical protein
MKSQINTLLAIGPHLLGNEISLHDLPTEKNNPHFRRLMGVPMKKIPQHMNTDIRNLIIFMHGNVSDRNTDEEAYRQIKIVSEARKSITTPLNIYLISCNSGSILHNIKRNPNEFVNTNITAFSGAKRPILTRKAGFTISETIRLTGINPNVKPTEVIGNIIPNTAETITYCEVNGQGEFTALKYNSPKKNSQKNKDNLGAFQNAATLKEYLLNKSITLLHGTSENTHKLNEEIKEHLTRSLNAKETDKAWHRKFLEESFDKARDNSKNETKQSILAIDASVKPVTFDEKQAKIKKIGETLIVAATNGEIDGLISNLITNDGADHKIKELLNKTIKSAAISNQVKAIKPLIDAGADCNQNMFGDALIIIAAKKGNIEAVEALVEGGASLLPTKYNKLSILSVLNDHIVKNKNSLSEKKIESIQHCISGLEIKVPIHMMHNSMFNEQNFGYILNKIDNNELSLNWVDTKGRCAANRYLVCTDPKKIDKNILDKLVTNANINYYDYKARNLLNIALKKEHSVETVGYLVDKMKECGVFEPEYYPRLEEKLQKRPEYLDRIIEKGPKPRQQIGLPEINSGQGHII